MEFEVGKWYKIENYYIKYSHSKRVRSVNRFYNEIHGEVITNAKYIKKDYLANTSMENNLKLVTDLFEIQQYLPDEHPDKELVYEYMEIKQGCTGQNFNRCVIRSNSPVFGHYAVSERIIKVLEKGIKYHSKHESVVYGLIGDIEVCFNAKALKPSTKEEYEAQFNVKEPVKEETKYEYEVVHCTTQEEWDFVLKSDHNPFEVKLQNKKWLNYREYSILFLKGRNNKDYTNTTLNWTKWNDIKGKVLILSFQEWCDKFNHINPFVKQEPTEDICKQCANLYFDGSVNTNQHNLCEGSHCDDMLEIQEEKMQINEFKKDDYIVLTKTSIEDTDFPLNYVFKQRETKHYCRPYLDHKRSNKNGWEVFAFSKSYAHFTCDWRYATDIEIAEYDRLGKPYDVNTLKTKSEYITLDESYIGKLVSLIFKDEFYDKCLVVQEDNNIYLLNNCHPNYDQHTDKSEYKYSLYFINWNILNKYCSNIKLLENSVNMEDLLKEAKERYPVGTEFKNASDGSSKYVVKRNNFDWWVNSSYKKGDAIHEKNSSGLIYCNGKWAEIISTPESKEKSTELTSLPEKWCILRNKDNHKIINQWFADNNYGRPYLEYDYIKISNTRTYYGSYSNIPEGCIEISFDQFKQWVMKKSVEDVIPEYVEATENQNSYFKKGIIYQVINSKSRISVQLITNIKSYYDPGLTLYVDFTENIYKPSTKEAFDLQNNVISDKHVDMKETSSSFPKEQLQQQLNKVEGNDYKNLLVPLNTIY